MGVHSRNSSLQTNSQTTDKPTGLPTPEWLDLKALTQYACVSERTLREWIHRPLDALPAVQVGGKILIRRTNFDRWLESHQLEKVDLDGIVDDLVTEVMRVN
jgi:excisionase family DNA binding protein